MQFVRCLLPVLVSLSALPAAADNVTDLLPPDTKMVFGIRVHNLMLSPMAKTIAAQAQAAGAGLLQGVPAAGVDFLRDIDEVLIATAGKGQNPPTLIVVTGRFDLARLAEGARHYYRDVPLLGGDSLGNGVMAPLDRGLAVLGDRNLVRAAIDQRSGSNHIDAALNDRITSLRQRYDIWGLGEQLGGFQAPVPQVKALESIDRFQFGMQLASGLELGAEIHARSPEDADKLRSVIEMIAAMLKGKASGSQAKFDLQADGDTLKLDVYIPESELKKVVETERAALSPVSIAGPTVMAEGSDAAPEAGNDPPPAGPPPAPATAAVAVAAPPAKAVSKSLTPLVCEPDQDTVVFKLPGKK